MSSSTKPTRKLATAAAAIATVAGFVVTAPNAVAAPDQLSGDLFNMINDQHVAAGCAPYGRSGALGDVSLQYAKTLAGNNGKLNPDTVALLKQKGYDPNYWGEMDYYNPNGATPQDALNFWNANPTKDLISNCDITQMEVSVWKIGDNFASSAIMGTPKGTPPAAGSPGNNNPPQPGSSAKGSTDSALLAAVNDARLHPEKYPPNGNANAGPGAKMTACTNAVSDNAALDNAANVHNGNISTVSVDDANAHGDWAHRNPPPSGPLSWESGGPLGQTGVNPSGEIVAMGFGSEAEAVQFWMQNDEGSNWGHRNNILNCAFTKAGASHLAGGAAGNYWTVDFGG